jgi:hypothetical protein
MVVTVNFIWGFLILAKLLKRTVYELVKCIKN